LIKATLTRATITDSRFAALKVKDAVVDVIRDVTGDRPAVRRKQPDVQVSLHVRGEDAVLSIDLSGDSLHRRGYRTETGGAPLRETLASAILVRAGWPDAAGAGASMVDPMCGSGTLLIEAALMAGDVAPGLERGYFGLLGWRGHDRPRWDRLLEEARERRRAGVRGSPLVAGWDVDARAVRAARRNAERAGVTIRVDRRDLADLVPPAGAVPGLVVTNPPYGERLEGTPEQWKRLGDLLKRRYGGWRAVVLAGGADRGKHIGLRPSFRLPVRNGPLEARILGFELY
jgi:23S rRNA (guanine2445-N2)-methyltransferase / 23S rRNA (guanine2069-N7)-methyltransferase